MLRYKLFHGEQAVEHTDFCHIIIVADEIGRYGFFYLLDRNGELFETEVQDGGKTFEETLAIARRYAPNMLEEAGEF